MYLFVGCAEEIVLRYVTCSAVSPFVRSLCCVVNTCKDTRAADTGQSCKCTVDVPCILVFVVHLGFFLQELLISLFIPSATY